MSIIWADFPDQQQGLYGTNTARMLNGIYAAFDDFGSQGTSYTSLSNDPDPSIGANGIVLRSSNSTTTPAGVRFVIPGGVRDTVGMGFRMWVSELPSGDWGSWQGALMRFKTASNVDIATVCLMSDGSFQASTTTSGSVVLGDTVVPVITSNAWNHVELKVVRSNTVGSIEIRVNGTTVMNATNLNLGLNDIGQVSIGVNNWNVNNLLRGITFYKDFIIWDDNGSNNNDFLGSCIVKHLVPDADVTLGGWTTSSGSTGFNLLSESPADDATFISAADPPPAPAQFSLTNLPADIVAVKALLPIIRSRKIDGGDGNLQAGLTGTLTDLGADNVVTTAFTYRWDISELSPDTGTPWTPVEVDAVKLDIDRTL